MNVFLRTFLTLVNFILNILIKRILIKKKSVIYEFDTSLSRRTLIKIKKISKRPFGKAMQLKSVIDGVIYFIYLFTNFYPGLSLQY